VFIRLLCQLTKIKKEKIKDVGRGIILCLL